jgi:hypothetical protein
MTRFRIVALSSGVALAASIAVAIAGTPFGGDDTGTIPSDAPKGPITKCENGVGKAVGKLVGALGKCTASRASGKLADDSAEDACEEAALTKFNATNSAGCGVCTNITATGAAVAALTDANNNQVYCTATGTPFGGDDTGNVPSDAPAGPITKCENGVNKAVGKLAASLLKCHASRANGKLTDDTAEDSCEATALTKFGATKTAGCDQCTNLATLGSTVASRVDGTNSLVYCGQLTSLTCPWTGPAVFDPAAFAACSPACGGAHCVPAGIVPLPEQSLLAACTDGLCAPDPLIATDGNYIPPSCVAFAGTGAEGRCLSTCLPGIAAQPSLEQSTCAAGDMCAPCTNPYTGVSTGSCTTSCDAPAQPPFTFPGCCFVSGTGLTGTCVPSSQVPAAEQSSLAQDVCPSSSAGYLCVPDEYLPGGTPSTCTVTLPIPGPGACVSLCLNEPNLSLFSQQQCPNNHVCVPCSVAPTTPGCS